MNDADLAAIAAHVAGLGIDEWAPLTAAEAALVRRALAQPDVSDERLADRR